MTLDIHPVLNRLDRGDLRVYDDVSQVADDKAQLNTNISWLIPQWFTGSTNNTDHRNNVVMFDLVCNPRWKSLYYHPEAQTKLLAAIGNGSTKHKFFRPTAKRKSNIDELHSLLQLFYEDIKLDEVVMYWTNTNIEDLNDLMDRAGTLPEQRSGICKQYKNLMKKL
jgi:hypothetical protein